MVYVSSLRRVPLYRLPWRSHRRLRLVLDADHPPAGSHHQKVVVIDDKVAFCGGIDITTSRWDTREHPADPAKRLGFAYVKNGFMATSKSGTRVVDTLYRCLA